MDILPTRGRRRRTQAPAAAATPFPWEQQAVAAAPADTPADPPNEPAATTPVSAVPPVPAVPSEPAAPTVPAEPAAAAPPAQTGDGEVPGGRRTRRAAREAGKAGSRAGRNLPAAIGVGVGLGLVVLASLFIRKEAFVAVVAVAVALAVWELTQAFGGRRITVPLVPVLVGSLGMVVSAFAAGEEALLVAFTLTALALMLWRVVEGVEGAVRDVAAGIFTAAYVPFLAAFTMLMLAQDDGPRRIIVFILVTIASDIGGYAVGVVAGRHPMAPSVSPKKSWEGLGGSVAACLLVGVLAVTFLLDGSWWAGALVGAAAVTTATVGDLSESLLKRDLGIKDMGSVLPGHGGMLDRIDSLLPTAPVVYLLLAVLVPVAS